RGDSLRYVGIELPELRVGARGRGLDPAEPVDDRRRYRLARYLEVLNRLARLSAPELAFLARCRHEMKSTHPPVSPARSPRTYSGVRVSMPSSSCWTRRSSS